MNFPRDEQDLQAIFGLENSSLEIPELEPYCFEYLNRANGRSITIIPLLHDQLLFSRLASKIFQEKEFDLVALELPQQLEYVLLQAIKRLPLPTVVHNGQLEQKSDDLTMIPHPANAYIVHPGETLYWMGFLAERSEIPIQLIDTWHPQSYETWKVPLDFPALATIGWERFWEHSISVLKKHIEQETHLKRSQHMGETLISSVANRIIFGCGAAHWAIIHQMLLDSGYELQQSDPFNPEIYLLLNQLDHTEPDQEISPGSWQLADIHPHSLHLVTSDLPFFIMEFIEQQTGFNYIRSISKLYFEAEQNYTKQFDDQVSPANYRRMFQYIRNLSRIKGIILPDLFNLISGAKGMVDDDYAFEVFRTAIYYPFTPGDEEKLDQMLKFTPDEKQGNVIKFAFKRRFKRPILKKLDRDDVFDDLDPIPEELYPGEWEDVWREYSKYGYVSYPPEDEFIENYLQFLRKRINEILMEEQASSMEFETSLEDGIDWRETMRHYHENKIYVKKYPRNIPEVGVIVVQFLEEPYDSSEYSHHATLFAEHDQESHISVITTQPGDVLVGPGISRVKYAAIISQFPPVGMPVTIPKENIDLKLRLIYAAMNMSLSKIIGFVAKRPPSAAQRHFAAKNGYRIIYLPMGQLTKASLHRIRTMHLLAHRSLRDIAREYIGF